MKLSLTTSGLLDPKRLDSWVPEKRRAIRKAVEDGMKASGREIAEAVRSNMKTVFKSPNAGFIKSMHHKIYGANLNKLPSLLIGSKIPWLGLHVRGGTITGKMLIPLTPEGKRMNRKAFRRVIDGLMRSGNAFFIKKNGSVILMAENIKENATELRRFKRAERIRTGAKSIKRGQEIPIAVLVSSVKVKARLNLPGIVNSHLPKLSVSILQQLNQNGL